VIYFSSRKARSIASAPATTPNREKEHDESHRFGCPHCVSADFRSFSARRGSRRRRRRKDLLGTWTLVSITIEQDGKKTDLFGPNPQGQETRAANGHVSVIITRSDLPQFASNNRAAGTPEENTAVVQGSIAYFGMSSGNERDIVYRLLGYI
jgi:lipocalin-like protein